MRVRDTLKMHQCRAIDRRRLGATYWQGTSTRGSTRKMLGTRGYDTSARLHRYQTTRKAHLLQVEQACGWDCPTNQGPGRPGL